MSDRERTRRHHDDAGLRHEAPELAPGKRPAWSRGPIPEWPGKHSVSHDVAPRQAKAATSQPARDHGETPPPVTPRQRDGGYFTDVNEVRARDPGPIQRQPDMPGRRHAITPETVQVNQFAEGTDPRRFNDCGPACVLMAVRAMGLERKLESVMLNKKLPTDLEAKLEFIRTNAKLPVIRDPAHDLPKGKTDALTPLQVRGCLVEIVRALGGELTDAQVDKLLPMTTGVSEADNKRQATPGMEQGPCGKFIEDHCVDGSAVIVMGLAKGGPWGWGGTGEQHHRFVDGQPQQISDQGAHFVFVWRPSVKLDLYIVMDPAWAKPQQPMRLAKIMDFIYARSTDGTANINVMAVPYADLAQRIPNADQAVQMKADVGVEASTAESGAAQPLPEATRLKMEGLFSSDFSSVQIHEGSRAAAVGARAYAQGETLHFAPGTYRPGSRDGDRLIGHELAHVVQQRAGRVTPRHGGSVVDDPALEAEADDLGDRAARDELGTGARSVTGRAVASGPLQASPAVANAVERLEAVAASARALANKIAPTEALQAGPPPALHVTAIKAELRRDTELVSELSTYGIGEEVRQAAHAANDAIVAAYQALAVHAADGAAGKWAVADPGERAKTVGAIRPAGTSGDWCGDFIAAQYVSAGLDSGDFPYIFTHTNNVEDFFRYSAARPSDNRIARWIRPFDDPHAAWLDLRTYHLTRGSARTAHTTAEVEAAQRAGALAELMRPGDVVTVHFGAKTTNPADHTVMVRRVTATGFESIEGNSYITTATGAQQDESIGTGDWEGQPPDRQDRTFRNPEKPVNATARVFLVGRPSVVDFEAGHGYSFEKPTAEHPYARKPRKQGM